MPSDTAVKILQTRYQALDYNCHHMWSYLEIKAECTSNLSFSSHSSSFPGWKSWILHSCTEMHGKILRPPPPVVALNILLPEHLAYRNYPSRDSLDFHLPQSQINITGPDFHLWKSQKCLLGIYHKNGYVIVAIIRYVMMVHPGCLWQWNTLALDGAEEPCRIPKWWP